MNSSHSTAPRRGSTAARRVAYQQAVTAKRNRQRRAAFLSIGLVIALFAALVLTKAATDNHSSSTASTTTTSAAATTDVVKRATGVPASVFASIGTGGTTAQAEPVPGGTALTIGGKPEVLYLGAEYCPYCAAQRWPLVLALSRFGTFTGLGLTESSSSDVYANTNTFTFLNATYTSPYLAFHPVEISDRAGNPLQTPTAAEQQLLETDGQGGIPFIDLGGTTMLRSSGYSPQVLGGMTWTQIATALTDTSSPAAQAIVGTANRITAQLCGLTHNQPAAVCQATEIKTLEATK
ncbi:MAG TPA: DUF929 family protein [Actinospica sp.]|jgi:hypothetical protein|nr:DUF929 family protein [Actinospica sp.]